jgi:hypothetical protein
VAVIGTINNQDFCIFAASSQMSVYTACVLVYELLFGQVCRVAVAVSWILAPWAGARLPPLSEATGAAVAVVAVEHILLGVVVLQQQRLICP